MTQIFYYIGGIDDVNLKQALLTSIPGPLSQETYRQIQTKGKQVATMSLGEIFQNVMLSLEKLCTQQKFLKEIQAASTYLGDSCQRQDLFIKCKSKDGTCLCPSHKTTHVRRWPSKSKASRFQARKQVSSSFPTKKNV